MITEQYLLSNKKQTKEYHEKMSWGVSKLKTMQLRNEMYGYHWVDFAYNTRKITLYKASDIIPLRY